MLGNDENSTRATVLGRAPMALKTNGVSTCTGVCPVVSAGAAALTLAIAGKAETVPLPLAGCGGSSGCAVVLITGVGGGGQPHTSSFFSSARRLSFPPGNAAGSSAATP